LKHVYLLLVICVFFYLDCSPQCIYFKRSKLSDPNLVQIFRFVWVISANPLTGRYCGCSCEMNSKYSRLNNCANALHLLYHLSRIDIIIAKHQYLLFCFLGCSPQTLADIESNPDTIHATDREILQGLIVDAGMESKNLFLSGKQNPPCFVRLEGGYVRELQLTHTRLSSMRNVMLFPQLKGLSLKLLGLMIGEINAPRVHLVQLRTSIDASLNKLLNAYPSKSDG